MARLAVGALASGLLVSLLFLNGEPGGSALIDGLATIPRDRRDLKRWWRAIAAASTRSPFCGVIVGVEHNRALVRLIEKHRTELEEMSGELCYFVWLRDKQDAVDLSSVFDAAYHLQASRRIAIATGLSAYEGPFLLVFKELEGEVVQVFLRGSTRQMLLTLHELFQKLGSRKEGELLDAVKGFVRRQGLSKVGWSVGRGVLHTARKALNEAMKAVVSSHVRGGVA